MNTTLPWRERKNLKQGQNVEFRSSSLALSDVSLLSKDHYFLRDHRYRNPRKGLSLQTKKKKKKKKERELEELEEAGGKEQRLVLKQHSDVEARVLGQESP
jgi:hypothetical protein